MARVFLFSVSNTKKKLIKNGSGSDSLQTGGFEGLTGVYVLVPISVKKFSRFSSIFLNIHDL